MPIIRAANARLDDELEPLPVSWSVFEDGSPEAGRIDILFDHQPDADAFVGEIGLEHDDVEVLFAPLPDEDWIAMSLEGLPSVEAGRFLVYGEHTSGDLAEDRSVCGLKPGLLSAPAITAPPRAAWKRSTRSTARAFAPKPCWTLGPAPDCSPSPPRKSGLTVKSSPPISTRNL
jgi:ribosomal protein L11 methyltransferase